MQNLQLPCYVFDGHEFFNDILLRNIALSYMSGTPNNSGLHYGNMPNTGLNWDHDD